MDLRLAKTDKEPELRAVEEYRNIRRFLRAEEQSILDLIPLYTGHARLLQAEILPLTRILVRCGKT